VQPPQWKSIASCEDITERENFGLGPLEGLFYITAWFSSFLLRIYNDQILTLQGESGEFLAEAQRTGTLYPQR